MKLTAAILIVILTFIWGLAIAENSQSNTGEKGLAIAESSQSNTDRSESTEASSKDKEHNEYPTESDNETLEEYYPLAVLTPIERVEIGERCNPVYGKCKMAEHCCSLKCVKLIRHCQA
ncbi:hypothetical protein KR009_011400 [Drosophila setifemur]|nr:hypothetical protein KR009_011400 [Drosophila setifemur]